MTESLISLIRVMVQSSAATWPHAPWFGLSEAFARPSNSDQQPRLAEALNLALREVGVAEWAEVKSVVLNGGGPGERRFAIALTVDGVPLPPEQISL